MAQEKFTECPFTAVSPQGWPGTTISVLSRIIVWRSPGTDTNTGEIGGPFLLVGNVG